MRKGIRDIIEQRQKQNEAALPYLQPLAQRMRQQVAPALQTLQAAVQDYQEAGGLPSAYEHKGMDEEQFRDKLFQEAGNIALGVQAKFNLLTKGQGSQTGLQRVDETIAHLRQQGNIELFSVTAPHLVAAKNNTQDPQAAGLQKAIHGLMAASLQAAQTLKEARATIPADLGSKKER